MGEIPGTWPLRTLNKEKKTTMAIQSINPATGELEKTFAELEPAAVISTLERVQAAYASWKNTPLQKRADCLNSLAAVLRDRAAEYAAIMAREMGKPVGVGKGEVLKCATVCEYYAQHGEQLLAPEPVPGVGTKAFVEYAPMGTVLSVMPWNFPYWQVVRIAAPTLMAGNTMVLKHASNVPQCAMAIEQAFALSDFPDDVFRTLLIGARQVETVLDHDSVVGVSLTGSEGAGRKVAAAAGARLKKSVMELGGSDPFIVLPDADLDKAASVAAFSRCSNTGQTCIAAKRFIVLEEVCDAFVQALSKGMDGLPIGDPMDPEIKVGPMASVALRDELQNQVDRCLSAGGKLIRGGVVPEGKGAYYPLTIIRDVPTDADVCKEELFGPVALVFSVQSVEEAVALANDTPFGLGGSVWTGDAEKGLEIARQVESGTVFVNGLVRSDPALAFGGIKNSGYGRELGPFGIRAFVNEKSYCVD